MKNLNFISSFLYESPKHRISRLILNTTALLGSLLSLTFAILGFVYDDMSRGNENASFFLLSTAVIMLATKLVDRLSPQ